MTGPILTAEQLAARWQIKPSAVYRLTREKKIPCVQLGRYYRYRLDSIEQFERGDSPHPVGASNLRQAA
jgi:excisionase family DNA binding protein